MFLVGVPHGKRHIDSKDVLSILVLFAREAHQRRR